MNNIMFFSYCGELEWMSVCSLQKQTPGTHGAPVVDLAMEPRLLLTLKMEVVAHAVTSTAQSL